MRWLFIPIHYRVLYTYAPFTDQPKLDRTVDEIPEVSKAFVCVCMCVCMCVCLSVCLCLSGLSVYLCVYCNQYV